MYRPSVLAAAAKVHCNALALAPMRRRYTRPFVREVELAIGTVLSLPLRPAMPDPHPHPLRFGWLFESRDLTEAEIASVRRHNPLSLVKGDSCVTP
jgi:hypothetical protein